MIFSFIDTEEETKEEKELSKNHTLSQTDKTSHFNRAISKFF